jgi:hypothetical protein
MTGQGPGATDWFAAFAEAQRSLSQRWLEMAGSAGDPAAVARWWTQRTWTGSAQGADALQQYVAACQQYSALGQALAELMTKVGVGGDPRGFVDGLSAWHRNIENTAVDPFPALRILAGLGQQAPGFGQAGAHTEAARRIAALQTRVFELLSRMLQDWADIGRETILKFGERVPAVSSVGADPPTLQALYEVWVECAEDVYATRAHAEEYCRTQAELVNAVNALRSELRSQMEEWARQLDLPTRSELNALILCVKRLEEELQRRSGPAGTGER